MALYTIVTTENCCTTEEEKSHGNWEDASRNFPGCCGMDGHSMGFSDDRHHPVGIQNGLIGADFDGESAFLVLTFSRN